MNFFTNPAYQALRSALIVLTIAGGGVFVFKNSQFNPFRNTATVIGYGYSGYGYALPAVVTNPATSVSTTGATLNGTITALNAAYVSSGFEYGTTTAYGTLISGTTHYMAEPYSAATIGSLTCNTTYHYRAWVANAVGIVHGGDMTFTTAPCPPLAVVTMPATVTVTSSSAGATLNGNLVGTGGTTSTVTSFQFGTSTAYGILVPSSTLTAPGTFAASVGISCGTTYHYRARATNSTGSVNGADMTFTTDPCTMPVVTTTAATAIGQTTATLNGTIAFTSPSSASSSFEYGLTTAYGTTVPAAAFSATGFNKPVTGLLCGKTYHYRARANPSTGGVVYGSDMTFTTSICSATIRTLKSSTVSPANFLQQQAPAF